jgi:hypothetical protein
VRGGRPRGRRRGRIPEFGTLLHTITEYADAGRLEEIYSQIPAELLDDLAAYLATMNDAGIERPAEYIERILINLEVDSAGTTDRILVMPQACEHVRDPPGHRRPQDPEVRRLRLAEDRDPARRIRLRRMPCTTPTRASWSRCRGSACHRGIVMHLPVGSGKCDLYEIDLEEGWAAASLAHQVRLARGKSKQMGWPIPVRQPDRGEDPGGRGGREGPRAGHADPHLASLVRAAGHPRALEALWREASAAGRWTDELTALAKLRKAEIAMEAA